MGKRYFVNLRRFFLPIGIILLLAELFTGARMIRQRIRYGVTKSTVIGCTAVPVYDSTEFLWYQYYIQAEYTVGSTVYTYEFPDGTAHETGETLETVYYRNDPQTRVTLNFVDFGITEFILLVLGLLLTGAGLRVRKGYFRDYVLMHKAVFVFTLFFVGTVVLNVVLNHTVGDIVILLIFCSGLAFLVPVLWFGAALSDDISALGFEIRLFLNIRRHLFVSGMLMVYLTVLLADSGFFVPVPFFAGLALVVLCFGSMRGFITDLFDMHKSLSVFTVVTVILQTVLGVLLFFGVNTPFLKSFGLANFFIVTVPIVWLIWLVTAIADDIRYIKGKRKGEI